MFSVPMIAKVDPNKVLAQKVRDRCADVEELMVHAKLRPVAERAAAQAAWDLAESLRPAVLEVLLAAVCPKGTIVTPVVFNAIADGYSLYKNLDGLAVAV